MTASSHYALYSNVLDLSTTNWERLAALVCHDLCIEPTEKNMNNLAAYAMTMHRALILDEVKKGQVQLNSNYGA
jgi:hypothetical protein